MNKIIKDISLEQELFHPRFAKFLTLKSLIPFAVFLCSGLIIFFNPTIEEFLIMFLIDLLSLALFGSIGNIFLLKRYPNYNLFLNKKKSPSDKASLHDLLVLRDLISFPFRRSIFVFFLNLIKVIPGGIYIIYFWGQDQGKVIYWQRGLIYLSLQMALTIYFASTLFVELNQFISSYLKKKHKCYNLSKVFLDYKIKDSWSSMTQSEILAVASLTIVMGVYNIHAIFYSQVTSFSKMILFVSSLYMILWFYYLSRKNIYQGLIEIFNQFEKINQKDKLSILSISSDPLISRFQITYNKLVSQLDEKERELEIWLHAEIEKSRFKTLSEITGMIAHDLIAPLNTVNFCIDELKGDSSLSENFKKYLAQMEINSDRALSLAQSLVYFLKDKKSEKKAEFTNALKYVLNILKTQYPKDKFNSIHILTDSSMVKLQLPLAQSDLIHVINNILSNSFKDLIENNIISPEIFINLIREDEEEIIIEMGDNGTGLRDEDFERMIKMRIYSSSSNIYQGLGLRLTQLLLERNLGRLELVKDGSIGTKYHIHFLGSKMKQLKEVTEDA